MIRLPVQDIAPIPFVRMNGLGNEIVVIDCRGGSKVFSDKEAAAIARQPRSRFDQLMVLHDARTAGTDAFVRIYNTDGSNAGACGNGTRCVAWLLAHELQRSRVVVETIAGVLECTVVSLADISVDMGRPRFGWREIPLAEAFHDTRAIELQVGPIDAPLIHSPSVVNVGNPHCVFFVDRLDVVDLGKVGPMLEHHRLFPERANISLARVLSPEAIEARVWERGAGLTRACGSGACAIAVCAARKGMTGRKVAVTLPGGVLCIEWREDDRILMSGPVEVEYEDTIESAALAVESV